MASQILKWAWNILALFSSASVQIWEEKRTKQYTCMPILGRAKKKTRKKTPYCLIVYVSAYSNFLSILVLKCTMKKARKQEVYSNQKGE